MSTLDITPGIVQDSIASLVGGRWCGELKLVFLEGWYFPVHDNDDSEIDRGAQGMIDDCFMPRQAEFVPLLKIRVCVGEWQGWGARGRG